MESLFRDDGSFQDTDLLNPNPRTPKDTTSEQGQEQSPDADELIRGLKIHQRPMRLDPSPPRYGESPSNRKSTDFLHKQAPTYTSRSVSQPVAATPRTPLATFTSRGSTSKLNSRPSAVLDADLIRRLVIAIDYGTTYTGASLYCRNVEIANLLLGVAVALVRQNDKFADLDAIDVIKDWGRDMDNTNKVPSAYSYTRTRGHEEQWGASMSPDSTVMIHTKLELDVQDTKSDELNLLLHNLDGMHNLSFQNVERSGGFPAFSTKKPDDIVRDYLEKIFARVIAHLECQWHIEQDDRQNLPVDIVFTVPVNWSYRAKNATYRSITGAGFNHKTFPKLRDILVLSEPEAAAIYTARFMKQKRGAMELLEEDECFIICDAGGGTVDVVTFKVTRVEPTLLEIEKVGIGKSRKCGSVFIDGEFKKWLRDHVLGATLYEHLEPGTNGRIKAHSSSSQAMRELMRQFIGHKQRFTGHESEDEVFPVELPAELGEVDHDAVQEGEILLVPEEMQYFFEDSLNQIMEMILEQRKLAEVYEQRVRTVFMIGGFGESKYLQDKLHAALRQWKIKIAQPDQPWTAVVRGAAMHGIEKDSLRNIMPTECSPHNYGIVLDREMVRGADDEDHQFESPVTGKTMGKGRIIWLVRRGDLMIPSGVEAPATLLSFEFRRNDARKFVIPLYRYIRKDDDDLPSRLKGAAKELEKVLDIVLDFTNNELGEFEAFKGPREPYYQAIVAVAVILVKGVIQAEATWNGEVLYPSRASPRVSSSNVSAMSGSTSAESRFTS